VGLNSDEQAHAKASGAYPGAGAGPRASSTGPGGQSQNYSHFYSSSSGGPGGFSGGQGFNFDESIFENFFGGRGGAARGGGGGGFTAKGPDLVLDLDISFHEAIKGTRKNVAYARAVVCPGCNGTKAAAGTKPVQCEECKGSGMGTIKQDNMVFRTTCQKCHGAGSFVKDPCKTCSGNGTVNMTQHEEIVIPAGIDNGQSLKAPGKGGAAPGGGVAGDLLIRVNVKPDPYFRREGPNIHSEVYLTISQVYKRDISSNQVKIGCIGRKNYCKDS